MDSFFAFSKKLISASAGVIPLWTEQHFFPLSTTAGLLNNQSTIFGQRGSNCYSNSIIHFPVPPRAPHVPKRNAKSECGKNRQMVLKYGGIYQV